MIKITQQTDNNITFIYKDKEYIKEYEKGDDAIYVKLDNNKGLKIIYPNTKYETQEVTYNNLLKFKENNYDFFPTIYDVIMDGENILLELEHIHDNHLPINLNHDWIPWQDKQFLEDNLPTDIDTLTKLNYSIFSRELDISLH